MRKTIIIKPQMAIKEGEEFYAFSEHLKVGDDVEICRGYDGRVGKPIATGAVTENGTQNAAAQAHPAPGTLRAWRSYWKIKVERIK